VVSDEAAKMSSLRKVTGRRVSAPRACPWLVCLGEDSSLADKLALRNCYPAVTLNLLYPRFAGWQE
jgi:hypothetical protein